MKKIGRKIAAAVCAAVVSSLLSGVDVLAISEDNEFAEFYESEIFDMDELYYDYSSSGYPLYYNSMADGTIDKKSGNYARWIDRFEVPECGMEFYNKLYEWTDNDGIDDYLIGDSYFEAGELVTGGGVEYYGAEISSLSFDEKLTSEQSSYYARMFAAVYAAFDYDNPQNFWLGSQYGITWKRTYLQNRYVYTFYLKLKSTDGIFDIRGEQYRNENSIKNGIALQNKCVDEIIAEAPLSRYERIKYFNNWLTFHNEYNTYVSGGGDSDNVPFSRECITALKGNIGDQGPVCEGYARAMKVLCDKVGIPCILVRGKSSNGVAHMWNNVMIDGKWYAVDVTWNDSVYGNEGAVSGAENEKWLLVGSDSLSGRETLNRLTSYVLDLTNQPIMETDSYVYTEPVQISNFVERLYENILNRPSDPSKVSHIDNLNNGESACKVAYDFVFSSEFAELPISNEDRVRRMYLTFLNREADPAGLADWTAVLDNGCSIGHIFYGFTQSNEFTEICAEYGITRGTWECSENRDKSSKLTAFVSRLYTKAMGRAYDVNGLNDHTGSYLENHDLYQLAYNFIFSQEFIDKNLTNEEFVDVMYRTFFDREADPAGKADWLDRMANQGYTREDVLAGFVGSQECIDLVARFGI